MMKTFKSFFAFFLVSVLVLSVNSCKNNSEDLGYFVDAQTAQRFKGFIDTQGAGAQIVDFRSKTEYDAGHIPGAIWIQATVQNTKSNKSSFCKEISEKMDKSKPVFLYGKKNDIALGKVVPGRVAKIGFSSTYYMGDGFESWKDAGFEVVVTP